MAISTTSVPPLGANYEVISSTTTWTPPPGYSVFDVIVLGAGGGGGGGSYAENSTYTYAFGGGGGAAGYGLYLRGLRITSPVSVTIGTGGTGGNSAAPSGGSGSNGTRGGRTVFGGYVAPGGGAGRGGFATTSSSGRSSSGSTNPFACYDEAIGTTAVYVPQASHSTSGAITAEGGSGGSGGGNVSQSGTSSTVPIRTAGGSSVYLQSVGGIYGVGTGHMVFGSSSRSTTDAHTGVIYAPGGVGQQHVGPKTNKDNTSSYYLITDSTIKHVGDLWWVPGGGGAGYGIGGGTTAGFAEGGYAGTSTAGGLHGYSTDVADTNQGGQSATDYGAGGGGAGGVFNTGVAGNAGGAGANGVVIVYWGM